MVLFFGWFSSSNVPDVGLGGACDPEGSGANRGGLCFSCPYRGTYPLCAAVNFTAGVCVCVCEILSSRNVHVGVYRYSLTVITLRLIGLQRSADK